EELSTTELANHPDRPEMGRRRVAAGPSFYLPAADVRRLVGSELRLKDLANIRLPPGPIEGTSVSARFVDRANRKLPRLQWVGASDAVPVDVLRTDGTHEIGSGEGTLRDAPPGEVHQFERYGFGRVETDRRPAESPVRVCFGH